MSYQAIVDGLTRVLKKLPEFSDGNISQADYKILTAGNAQCIVLFPGQFTTEFATLGGVNANDWVDWEIRIELYVRYSTDDDVATAIARLRENILEKTMQYPFLDATAGVLVANIRRGDAPIPVFKADGSGPFYWLQTIHMWTREELDITGVE